MDTSAYQSLMTDEQRVGAATTAQLLSSCKYNRKNQQ